jgi:hypothetical protein
MNMIVFIIHEIDIVYRSCSDQHFDEALQTPFDDCSG